MPTSEKGGYWKDKDNVILEVLPDGRQVVIFEPCLRFGNTRKYIKKLCGFYHQAVDAGQAEPLLLVASFMLDFECVFTLSGIAMGGNKPSIDPSFALSGWL